MNTSFPRLLKGKIYEVSNRVKLLPSILRD